MKLKDVNKNDLSPMMRQYYDIKEKYENIFLFYRVGDFYELFFDDAILGSKLLDITLTGKLAGLKERVPMAGIPHHSVKTYIEKLVTLGYKVALCDQVEDPKDAKDIVKREVIEVFTKGTLQDLDFLDNKNYNYTSSILKFNNLYYFLYTDISTGEINVSIIKEKEDLLSKISIYNIREILTTKDIDISLVNDLKNIYNVSITYSKDKLEEDLEVINLVDDIYIKESIKFLFHYLKHDLLKDISFINKVNIIDSNDYLMMDSQTITNLELFETLRLKERQNSLIYLIDKCKTSMGSRELKNFLINPLTNEGLINERYDLIETLNTEFILKSELIDLLKDIYDLERLSLKASSSSFNARDLIQIKNSIKVLPAIIKILDELDIKLNIDSHIKLYNLLEKAINEDAPVSVREGSLIKDGYSKDLDELKEIRTGGKDFLLEIEKRERERTKIPTLKVGYNRVFGYYLEITKANLDKVKDEYGYVRKQTLTNSERFITDELKTKEDLILNAEDKITTLEYDLFIEIKEIFKEEINLLKETSNAIGYLDAIISLSVVSEMYNFTRPTFNNKRNVIIKESFHPVIKHLNEGIFVNNDYIIKDNVNTLLITGPNMSGKSTYMRQLAIIIILAQIGSFVPAKSADLFIYDKIYTRIGASDDLVKGESTFMVEMLEAKKALEGATNRSLILFDELGRGTATYDGMSLAEAILEYVNEDIKAILLFSTHYHELTRLSTRYPSIKNVHVSAKLDNGELIFHHKIKPGSIDKSYGVHVAQLAGLPSKVVKRAEEILYNYESTKEVKRNESQVSFDFKEEKVNPLEDIDVLNMTPVEALNTLYELKQKYDKK